MAVASIHAMFVFNGNLKAEEGFVQDPVNPLLARGEIGLPIRFMEEVLYDDKDDQLQYLLM